MADPFIVPKKKIQATSDAVGELPAEDFAAASVEAEQRRLVGAVEVKPVKHQPLGELLKQSFGIGTLDTVVGQAMIDFNSPDNQKQEGWRTPEIVGHEVRGGYHSSEYNRVFLEGAKNEKDWRYRMGLLDEFRDNDEKLAQSTGLTQAANFGARMLGGMSNSSVEMLAGAGAVVPAMARVTAATSGINIAARIAGSQVAADSLTSVLRQSINQSEVLADHVLMDTATSLIFNAIPVGVAAKKLFDKRVAMGKLDEYNSKLVTAIDANEARPVVEAHAANIEEIKTRLATAAEKEGDVLAAEVWKNAHPAMTSKEVDALILDLKKADTEVLASMRSDVLPDAVEFHRPDVATSPAHAAEIAAYAKQLTAERGLQVSPEAASILHRAHKVWNDTVPESLHRMQERLDAFYAAREGKLGDYKGVAHWLDSPGLKFQLEKSRVTRMLGSLLVESASGKGKREFTAALDYEKMRGSIEHKYIPALKEAMWAHRTTGEKTAGLFGAGVAQERAFWYAVQLDRLSRREHIKSGAKGEYVSDATEHVQQAGKLLDGAWADMAQNLTARGHELGEAITGGGFVGHMPYHFDSAEVARVFRTEPEKFSAMQQLLKDQFNNKVLKPSLDDLEANWGQYIDEHVKGLRDTVTALQEQLGSMDETRRGMQTLRDTVQDADHARKELWATIDKLTEAERVLRQELADLEANVKPGEKKPGDIGYDKNDDPAYIRRTSNEDMLAYQNGEPLEGEVARFDATAFLDTLLLRLDEDSVEYHLAKQLLTTSRAEATSPQIVLRNQTERSNRSYYFPHATHNFISLRTEAKLGEGIAWTPQIAASRLTNTDIGTMLHEFSHYRTSALVDRGLEISKGLRDASELGPEVVWAAQSIDKLRNEVAYVLRGQTLDYGTEYALTNNHEFLAQFFNSQSFREQLHKQKYKGETVFSSILNSILEVLGFSKTKSAFTEMHSFVSELLDAHGTMYSARGTEVHYSPAKLERLDESTYAVKLKEGEVHIRKEEDGWYSDDYESGLTPAGKTPREAADTIWENTFKDGATQGSRIDEIKKQLADLKANKQKLKDTHAEAKATTDEAKAGVSSVSDTENVRKLRAVELALSAKRAALADAEANPEGVKAKMKEQLTKAADKKSDDLSANYLREIMTSPEGRVAGKELRYADYAAQILAERWDRDVVTPKMAEDFRAKLSERLQDRTRTELDLTKTVDVDGKAVRLLDLLEVDGEAMVKRGAHSTSGKAALSRKGLADERMQQGALEAMARDGAKPQTVEEMKFIFDVFAGRIDPGSNAQSWSAVRNLVAASRLGKLSEAMLADIPAVIANMGLAALPRVFGKAFGMFLNGSAFVHNGSLTEFGKQLAVVAPSTLGMDYRLHTLHAEGGAGESAVATASVLSRLASRGAQMTGFLSLANTVNSVVHRAATPIIADEIMSAIATGKSAFSDARLADIGLSPDDLTMIQKYYAKHDSARKPGEKVNWDKWEGEEGQYSADLVIGAIHRGVFQTVQKGLIGEKPSWTGKTQLGQTLAQLHNFGMIAAEKQAMRNIAHGDSNAVLFMTVGAAWAATLYLARVHASALERRVEDREEYIKRRMSGMAFATGMMSLWNASGIMPEALSLGSIFWGNKEEVGGKIETTARGGGAVAALGYAEDVSKAAGAVGNWVRGVEDTRKMTRAVKQIVPGGNSRAIGMLLAE